MPVIFIVEHTSSKSRICALGFSPGFPRNLGNTCIMPGFNSKFSKVLAGYTMQDGCPVVGGEEYSCIVSSAFAAAAAIGEGGGDSTFGELGDDENGENEIGNGVDTASRMFLSLKA
ncbi:hypothetical protein ACE6H2_024101 [Prunus campanulata]